MDAYITLIFVVISVDTSIAISIDISIAMSMVCHLYFNGKSIDILVDISMGILANTSTHTYRCTWVSTQNVSIYQVMSRGPFEF